MTFEFLQVNVSAVEAVNAAKENSKTPVRRYKAKVSHCDVVNGNNRIYPREVFAAAIESLEEKVDGKTKLEAGYLSGAVDHASWFKGNLSDSPIIWRSLKIESDGSVSAEFDLLLEHSKGKDLAIQIDGGMAIGFSTSSYCEFHPASEEDAKKYKLKYVPDGVPVWVADRMRLVKIDAVDDPSEHSARLLESLKQQLENSGFKVTRLSEGSQIASGEPVKAPEQSEEPNNMADEIKTLDDLKKAYPNLFTEAVTQATNETVKPTAASINKFLESVKDIPGVQLPLKEVLPAEFASERTNLQAKITALESQVASAKTEADSLKAKIAEHDAKVAQEQKMTKLKAKLEESLKDAEGKPIAFADRIRTAVERVLPTLEEDKVLDEVKETSKLFDGVNAVQPATGPAGSNAAPTNPTDDEIFANDEDDNDLIDPEYRKHLDANKSPKK